MVPTLVKVRIIQAQEKSFYNFVILRKKRDSNAVVFLWNLWNSHDCFWKHITYYVITNYVGLKLAICNVVLLLLLLLLHLLLSRWWDMRLEHDVVWLWEERADSRNLCLKWKVLLFMLYYIDKNWYHFITVHLE